MRHGALPDNPQRRFIGQQDVMLSERGRAQARAWHERLRHAPLARIVCSDLARCVETANIVRGGRRIPLATEPGLREICLGAWEGLTPAEVEERHPGAYAARGRDMARFQPEGGESFARLAERALPVFARWLNVALGGEPVLVVAHAGVNRVILAHILAMPLQDLMRIPQPYACCTEIPLPLD